MRAAEDNDRGHRAAKHAERKAQVLRNADRGRVIDRARADAHIPVQNRAQSFASFAEGHSSFSRQCSVIARSKATKQSSFLVATKEAGLLRFARNDGCLKQTPKSARRRL